MACLKCNRAILRDENQYFVADMGPELSFIIEQEIAHEVTIDALLCEACFISVTTVLETTYNDYAVESKTLYERNVCVWCLLSLSRRRTHLLTSGPQRDIISNKITPRQIPDGARVCHRCWTCACRLQGVATSDSNQSKNICIWCRCSLAFRRRHIISDGPERAEICARIAPRQILPGDQVCYACWVSARRNVQRANNPSPYRRNICIVCSMSIVRRRTHLLLRGSDLVRDIISRRIYPRQISNHSLVCSECWTWAQDAVRQENEQPLQSEHNQEEPQQVLDMPRHIQLNTYRKIGTSSARCFVAGCSNAERHKVPGFLRKFFLSNYRIYITEHARVCMVHKTTYDWDHILDSLSNVFSAEEIEKMMQINNDLDTVQIMGG